MKEGGDAGGIVVEVELGFDRFTAATIVETCRAEGFDVEFLQMDQSGVAPGLAALAPHRLLTREADINDVIQIVNRSFPQTEHDSNAANRVQRVRPRRIVVRVVAVVLILILLTAGPVIFPLL